MNFKYIIVIIAFLILIVSLFTIGYILYSNKSDNTWPPLISFCPDYWIDKKGDGKSCLITKNIEPSVSCNIDGPIDFSNLTTCEKFNWANKCNVTWDGITNSYNNPCSYTQ
jgi:hypothetical protein